MFADNVENRTLVRAGRHLIDFLTEKTIYESSASGSGSQIHMSMGDTALLLNGGKDSPGRAGLKAATKLIEDGGEFIRTPLKWIKHMQDHWLIYAVCVAIICLCSVFLYCTVRAYFARKCHPNTSWSSQFLELATIMGQSSRANHAIKSIGNTSLADSKENNE